MFLNHAVANLTFSRTSLPYIAEKNTTRSYHALSSMAMQQVKTYTCVYSTDVLDFPYTVYHVELLCIEADTLRLFQTPSVKVGRGLG